MTERHPADTLADLELERRLNNSRIAEAAEVLRKNHRDRVGAMSYAYPDPVTGKMTTYALPTWAAISEIADEAECKALFIDTETTGLNVFNGARPVSIGVVDGDFAYQIEGRPTPTWRDEQPYGKPHPISVQAAEVNGYTQERIDAMIPWLDCDMWALQAQLESVEYVVGHNVWFDLGMISATFHDTLGEVLDIDPAKVIDTQVIAGMLFPGEKTSLAACLARYGLTREGAQHGALEDAKLTKRLLSCLWQTAIERGIDAQTDVANLISDEA